MEETVEIQEPLQYTQPDPPRKKLWNSLRQKQLYTKSYEDFDKQFSTPESIGKLHKVLSEKQLYTKTTDDFKTQFFSDLTPTSKKKVGTIGFEGSSLQAGNVLSQSGGVVGEEIPQIEMYTLLNGEMVETDPVSISRKYKELKDRKKTVTEGVGSSFGMGTGTTKEVEDEESQKAAKKLSGDFLGIDIEGIYEDTQGLSDDLVRVYNNDILPDREWNNQLYQRKLANIKWRSSFEKKLLEDVDKGNIDPDNYNRIKHGIEQLPISTGQGDYSNQRAAVKSLAADIREYGGENRDKLLKDFAVEVSKVYGNPDNKAEEKFKDSPESKYLNTDAQLGYQYLQDVSPDKAEQYKRLFIDPKSLKDNPDELRGYNHLMQTLEETGINLKQNAVTEELNSLNKQAKINGGLTPEQIERATKLEKVNEELSAKRNELDSKYPDRIGDKIDDAVQEVMGQRTAGFDYAGGKVFTAFRNTAQGVWEAASSPFMSDESNTLRELAIMGQSLEDEKIYHKTDRNKALQYDTMVIQPELQKEVDLIKNNNLLTDDQKEQKLYKLFRENTDKFGRVPIKNGEFNINPSSILYGMTDLGTSLLPFVAIEAATGGIGGAGAGAKFLRTFTAAASSTFHDEYAAALMEGKSQSEAYRSAMASTAINSLAMAGAGTPTEIRAMASTKTSAGKLIKSMSDDAIESVLKKGTPKGLKAVSQNVKERLKATPKMIKQGVKTGAKFEAYMSAANAINGREQDFKRSLLAIGEFGILGAALGQAAFKTPTQLQKSAGLEFGKKPDEYIAIAESMKKDGLLTDAQLEQRTELIKSYGEAYKSLPKNLDEKQQREYLYQTVIKNEASKGKSNLPPKQAAEAEHQAMVADYKREIILDQPTEKELESRKSYLERMIELKDEEGKLVLDEKEAAKGKAEIEAIDTHLDTTKKEVKEVELPNLSQPIEGVNEKGIPLTEIAPEEIQRQMQPITDKMAEVERQFENEGYKIDWDYDNEIQVTDKKGNQLDPEDIPQRLHKAAAEYEKATSKLGEFSHPDFIKSLENSRKRISGEETTFEEVKGQPEQITQPIELSVEPKTEENAIQEQTTNEMDVRQQTTNGEGVGEGNIQPEIPTQKGEVKGEEVKAEPPFVEEKRTILSHRGLQEVATEFNLSDITSRERKSDPQLFKDAGDTIDKWVENGAYSEKVEGLVNKAQSGEILTDEQRVILQQHIANVRNEVSAMGINSPEYNARLGELQRLIKAGEATRSAAGAALRVPFMASAPNDLPTMMVENMERAGTTELTEKQKQDNQKEYTAISKTEKAYQDRIAALEAELFKKNAERKVGKVKATTTKTKKTKEDFVKEREGIKKRILDKWDKAKNVGIVSNPKDDLLIQIAPDVAKLMRSYVEEGVSKLEDIVTKVHDEIKGFIPDLKEKDVHDIIAGVYNEKKQTKNEIAEKIENIRIEAKLINQLEALMRGEEPKNEKAKIKRNAEIERLRQQIKSFGKEEKTPDQKSLQALKTKMLNESQKLREQLQSGDYSKEPPKQPIKLDAEALKLRDELIKLRQNREVRLLLEQRMNETAKQKGARLFTEILNIPRTLMTVGDFSGLLRQDIFFAAGHPLRTAAAAKEMFKTAVSQKDYDRWFADLKEDPRYLTMQKSRLAIADSISHDLTKREEAFMSTLAEKIPVLGKTLIKGSERSYTSLLNKSRVDMFNYFADAMEQRGVTFENNPKAYKAMAEYINNATGRSDFGETLNRVAPVLNSVFFSPRLIASRVNMLTYWAQPRFWKTLPKEVKIDYFRNWISLLAVGGSIMALAKAGGAEVEDDPRSSDFGKIKSGNTRWDIWGGAQPYIRVMAQITSGKRKSTNSGKIYDLNGDDIFGETRAGVITDFSRNKLAPVPGAIIDILSQRTGVGDRIIYQWGGAGDKEISLDQYVKQRLLPMTVTGTEEALKDRGTRALFDVMLPSVFGVGTQTYSPPKPKPQKKKKPQKQEKK